MRKKLKWIMPVFMVMCFMFTKTVLAASNVAQYSAAITSAVANVSVVNAGDPVTITVTTNSFTSHVWVQCGSDTIAADYHSMNALGIKTWTAVCTPTQTQALTVYANSNGSLTGAVTSTVNVNIYTPPAANVTINGITTKDTVITVGNAVDLKIRTNVEAQYVWIECDEKKQYATFASQSSAGVKTWNVTVKPTKTQEIAIYANASDTDSGAVTTSQEVTVQDAVSTISGVTSNQSSLYVGESVTLNIRTNVDTQYVWVECDGSTKSAKISAERKTSKTWTVSVTPSKSQSLIIYANTVDSTKGAATRNYSVKVTAESVTIRSASAKLQYNSYVNNYYNDLVITVETNGLAKYVWADLDYQTVELTHSSTDRNGNKTWTATVRDAYYNYYDYYYNPNNYYNYNYNYNQNITVYASETRNGKDASKTVTISGYENSASTGAVIRSITSTPANGKYSIGDTITLTITTNVPVNEVWVYDNKNKTEGRALRSGSNYTVWYYDVKANNFLASNSTSNSVSVTFTAYVYDNYYYNNNYYDAKSITVSISK